MNERDLKFMRIAISEARAAADRGEVPVGACITDNNGSLIGAGFNRTISENDPTAHAEIVAIRSAAAVIGNYRLVGLTIYTTIEPCVMCAGALVNARLERLVYGAADERFGAAGSVFSLCNSQLLNHRIEVTSGVLAEECGVLMRDFFRFRRWSQT